MLDVSEKPLAFKKDGGLIIFDTIEECRACDWKKLKLSRIITSSRWIFEDLREAESKIERYEKLFEENDIDYHEDEG